MHKRPTIRYTLEKGWINDPNGLIYIDGTYYLFAQDYTDAQFLGPIHWAHSVSADLINWKKLPIALYLTDTEYIFLVLQFWITKISLASVLQTQLH